MGFWSNIANMASRGYETIKQGIGLVWSPVKSVISGVTNMVNKFDNFLGTYLNDVPYIGGLVNIVRENPVYKDVLGTINTINTGVGLIEQAGRDIDAAISPYLQGQRAGPSTGFQHQNPSFDLRQPPAMSIRPVSPTQ